MIKRIQKKLIYAAITAIVMVTGIVIIMNVFLLAPQRKAIKIVEERIEGIDRNLICPQPDGDTKKLKDQLLRASQTINKYVISSEDAADLAVDINKIANKIGLRDLRSTNRMQNAYSQINECQHIREGRIQITFKSTFNQFAEFINSLERDKPVIFVDYFKINHPAGDSNVQEVEIVLCFFVGQDSLKTADEVENSINFGQTFAAK